MTKGERNFDALREALSAKFGEGKKNKSSHPKKYEWGNPLSGNTHILLVYDRFENEGTLIFAGVKILDKIVKFELKRRKEKAKQGGKRFLKYICLKRKLCHS